MNKNLSDDARLTESGRILALGALRLLQDKRQNPELRIKNTTCAKLKPMADCGR
jgi:hypothetical protein